MENREIARMLWETADLMEIAGEDGFRIRSYRNAASVIEGYPEPISAILKDPEGKVTDIPGIGKGIASALDEIEQRGSFERRDQMLEVASEPIQPPAHHDIEAPSSGIGEQLIEGRTPILGARHPLVDIFDRRPASRLCRFHGRRPQVPDARFHPAGGAP